MYLLAVELFCFLFVPLGMPLLSAEDMPATATEKLKIIVLEGDGAINNVRRHVVRTAVVKVEDQDREPIAGAVVVFTLPSQGPSGQFPNGLTLTTITDQNGVAAAHGLTLNTLSGKMEIRVNASYRGSLARTTVTQFNMLVPETVRAGSRKKKVIILAVAGAAVVGGVLAGTQIGSGSSRAAAVPAGPVPIGITPGAGAAGPPR